MMKRLSLLCRKRKREQKFKGKDAANGKGVSKMSKATEEGEVTPAAEEQRLLDPELQAKLAKRATRFAVK